MPKAKDGKPERNDPRMNLAFYGDNLEFCKDMAWKNHQSTTQYINDLIAKEKAKHITPGAKKMKLLFLTEKPTLKNWIETEFAKCSDSLSYTIDVACVTSFIIADEEAERFHINTEEFECFTMKTRSVPANFKIHRNYLPNHRGALSSLLICNNYAYIVNACDPDKAGELMFDYTRENCDIWGIPTIKFDMRMALRTLSAIEAFKNLEFQFGKEG